MNQDFKLKKEKVFPTPPKHRSDVGKKTVKIWDHPNTWVLLQDDETLAGRILWWKRFMKRKDRQEYEDIRIKGWSGRNHKAEESDQNFLV